MDDRSTLAVLGGADGGQRCADTGTDILPHQDRDSQRITDRPRHRQRLQDTDGGAGGLDHGCDDGADQHAHERILEHGQDLGKLRVVPQTVHGTRHDIHAVHQHRKPDHDKSQILPAAVPLEEAVLQYARNTQHRRENGHNIDTAAPVTQQRQGKQKRRDGSPHVGTHDDADRLRQRHDAGVDESDDHDRRGGGGLYQGGHDQPEQEALELIGSQLTENGLHLVAGEALQRVAHDVHSEKEQGKSAQKLEYFVNTHIGVHPL